jgi:hypothetical protein
MFRWVEQQDEQAQNMKGTGMPVITCLPQEEAFQHGIALI